MRGANQQQASPAAAHDASKWQSPIDLSGYDRSPLLTPEEQRTLRALSADLAQGHLPHPTTPAWTALARLIGPLDDARLSLVLPPKPAHRRSACQAVALILHGCALTQTSFWSWDAAGWVARFGPNQRTFRRSVARGMEASVRPSMVGIAYLLDCFSAFHLVGRINRITLATRIFGPTRVSAAIESVMTILEGWGYHSARRTDKFPGLIATILLLNRSPDLADITPAIIERLRRHEEIRPVRRSTLYSVHRALAALELIEPPPQYTGPPAPMVEGVDATWQAWVERWTATSPLTYDVRSGIRSILLKVGRWLASEHPAIHEPAQWTRELCAAYIALVERLRIGDYAQRRAPLGKRLGQPVSAATKASYIIAVRRFFHDCHDWEWIPVRFDPSRALAIPRSIRALTGPNPRVIADELWAKLLWAGLNLELSDLPANAAGHFYPLELVRALALVWLFGGLRSDEIVRLRVGCIRWHADATAAESAAERVADDRICLLDVPIHKTGTAFTKPVDPLVGRAIAAWEAVRPAQPPLLDRRTGESVQFLFCYRARQVGREYINVGIIPALCRKAGVPQEDVRGRITSHRARATIASQLYNAKEPMTLFELQAWLGHRSAETTQYYARITPTTLAKAYTDAEYFARNVRTIDILIDREAVENGTAAAGVPWQYYDLGHGYCTYSFFEQCPHRMACARCTFYVPKEATRSQLLEAKASLQRMRACIPLTEEERAAVEADASALDRLLDRLIDVPTPAGPTPRQLAHGLVTEDAITVSVPHAHSRERREERR